MEYSSVHLLTPRKDAIDILSRERGRDPDHPLHCSCISKWCADLGIPAYVKDFDATEMAKLRAINRHYARGRSRAQLLKLMGDKQWYLSTS